MIIAIINHVSRFRAHVLAAVLAVLLALVAGTGPALAHTGEDASLEHIIVEVARWTVGIAAVLGVLVAGFWLRARRAKGHQS